MSVEVVPGSTSPPVVPEPLDRRRPNVSGDLRTVFQAAPMFRRAVGGYDRFQVDTYVRWAEDELASAGRERDDLLARHARLRADLDEARRLLAHTPTGQEHLRVSHRIGVMLAAAADQAEAMRADAEAVRAGAEAERAEAAAGAERILAGAAAEAERLVAEAAADAERIAADADAVLAAAERAADEVRAEAEARLDKVRAMRQQALEEAERLRQDAVRDATAARLQTRDEIVGMLAAGREQRRRADAEAAAIRDRLDRDAVARRAALLAGVEHLERRPAPALSRAVGLPVPRETPAGDPGQDPDRKRTRLHLGWHRRP